MLLLTRGLPLVLELGLLIYCLIDCVQTPGDRVRHLPKWGWIVLIVFVPLAGGIAWLYAGRPRKAPGERRKRVVGPDDDPDFLASLDQPPPHPTEPPHEGPVTPEDGRP